MSPHVSRGRRPRFSVLIGVVAAALALGVVTGCGEDGASVAGVDQAVAAEHTHATASPVIHTEAGHAFQDDMQSEQPLALRGLARVDLLIGDGASPLYRGLSEFQLRSSLLEILATLDPFSA